MSKVSSIHHVQITIPKGAEEQGRAFYCQFLGLIEIEKPDSLKNRGGFWLRVGDRELHVGTEDGVKREKTKAHVALEVQDLGLWKENLSKNGIEIGSSIPIPGYDRLEFRDPFGNRVELIQRVL